MEANTRTSPRTVVDQARLIAFSDVPPRRSAERHPLRFICRPRASFRVGLAFSSLWVSLRHKSLIAAGIAAPVISLCVLPGFAAQDATWLATASSGDFNNPDNWIPAAPPEGPTGTATFNNSSIKTITFSQPQFPLATTIGTLQFQAPGYTVETTALDITGNGIQASMPNAPNLNFFNSGAVDFQGTSTAGPAKITLGIENDIDDFDGGFVMFHNNSTAGNATITAFGDFEH